MDRGLNLRPRVRAGRQLRLLWASLLTVLLMLVATQALAACTAPNKVVTRFRDAIPTHYNVYRGCATRHEAEAACAEFSQIYRASYKDAGCNWFTDEKGRHFATAGHYQLAQGMPFYWLVVFYGSDGRPGAQKSSDTGDCKGECPGHGAK